MSYEVFTQSWADAWAAALNASDEYRTAAAGWEGAVALVMNPGDGGLERAVVLDLWHGRCRNAAVAGETELREATYVFEGTLGAWRQVLAKGGSPIQAILTGKIRITRGSIAGLLPYVNSAKELLLLAGVVPTRFPEG